MFAARSASGVRIGFRFIVGAMVAMLVLATALFFVSRAEALPPAVTVIPGQAVYEARGGDPIDLYVDVFPNSNGEVYSFQFRGIAGQGSVTGLISTGDASAKATYRAPDGYTGRAVASIRAINQVSGVFSDGQVIIDVNPKTELMSGPGVGITPGLTTDTTPTFEFRAVTGQTPSVISGATFACELDGSPVACTGPSFTTAALSDGAHTFKVRASSGSDATDPLQASSSFTVDTTAPVVSITGGPTGRTQSTSASFTFTNDDPTATVECKLDSGSWEACSSPKDYSGLAQDDHTFQVRATDPAGNEDSDSRSWTADTVASVTIDSGPLDGNTDATPGLTFYSPLDTGIGFRCRVYETGQTAPPLSICSSPYTSAALNKNVSYTFEVKVTDDLGNTETKSRVWTQSNTAPTPGSPTVTVSAGDTATVDLSSGATDADSDTLGSYTVTSAGSGGIGGQGSRITPGTANSDTGSVQVPTAGNAAGTYTFSFTVSDGREGGVSDGTATVRVRPDTKDITDPTSPISDSTPEWSFTSVSGTTDFECRLLTSADVEVRAWESCSGGTYAPSVADGTYKIEVRAKLNDLVDSSPLTSGLVEVDTASPDVDITGPSSIIDDVDALNNVESPAFTFATTDPDVRVYFECRTDQEAPNVSSPQEISWTTCVSGDAVEGLEDGDRTFEVRAVDAAGNDDSSDSYEWERDTIDPEFVIDSGPAEGDWTNLRRPTWTYTESDPNEIADDKNLLPATTTCQIDSGSVISDCPSPWASPGFLNDGAHKLTLTVQDAAGNTGTEEANFRVVTTAPVALIDSGPESPSGPDAEFEFSTGSDLGPDGGFECRTSRNGAPFSLWAECESPYSLADLESGIWTLDVRAVDSAGNKSSGSFIASYIWSTIGTIPVSEITAVNASNGSAAFGFRSTNDPVATFECRIDGGLWAACQSPRTFSDLSVGEHTFQVRAVNQVGTFGNPEEHVWTVSAPQAPQTEITRRPAASTTSDSATFEFGADDPLATFECRLDGGTWGGCTSPKAYEDLALGSHTFEVRATGVNEAIDQSPASYTWAVVDQLVDPVPAQIALAVSAPKAVKSGGRMSIRVKLSNAGTEAAAGAEVCLSSPTALIKGKAKQCRALNITATDSRTFSFGVRTKPGNRGSRARFNVTVEYISDGVAKKQSAGHVTVLK